MKVSQIVVKNETNNKETTDFDVVNEIPFKSKCNESECNEMLPGNQSEDYFYFPASDVNTAEEIVISMDIIDEIETPNLDTEAVENSQEIEEQKNIILPNGYVEIPQNIDEQNNIILHDGYLEIPQNIDEQNNIILHNGYVEIPQDRDEQDLNIIKQESLSVAEENEKTVKTGGRPRGRPRSIKLSENRRKSQISYEEKENPPVTKRKRKTVNTRNKRKDIKLSEKIGNRQITFDSNVTYTCGKCKIKFNSKSLLTHHIKTTHSKNNKFTCKICAMKTTTGYNYRRHLIRFHSRATDPEIQDLIITFLTSPRNKVFPVSRSDAKFPCSKCTKQFSSENTRKQHMERLHSKAGKYANSDSVPKNLKRISSYPSEIR